MNNDRPLAGSLPIETPKESMQERISKCDHVFQMDKMVLHKKTLFGNEEMLVATVWCNKCGTLTSSARIKF